MIFVGTVSGQPNSARWVFDMEVNDPTEPVDGLAVDGSPGISWSRVDLFSFEIAYEIPIAEGQEWANSAGAGGILGVDGGTLAAGSGTLETG